MDRATVMEVSQGHVRVFTDSFAKRVGVAFTALKDSLQQRLGWIDL